MKIIKQISSFIAMLILMASFSQCSSAQKLQKKAPTTFGEVYCENWVAGIQGGGSGVNLFIPIKDPTVIFDSVYFRGKVTKLEIRQDHQLLIGRFKTNLNQAEDIILSSDSKKEYANQMPVKDKEIPFQLQDDECVVSYQKNGKTLYYKITNIIQKEPLNYPRSVPIQNLKKK